MSILDRKLPLNLNHNMDDGEIRKTDLYEHLRDSSIGQELSNIGFANNKYSDAGDIWALYVIRNAMHWLENPDSYGEPDDED
jgi:hypothetical protein